MRENGQFDARILLDSAVADPCLIDLDFPCEQFVTHFISQGAAVHATIWIAQGREPKGTLILSPQWFGGDRLESVIIPAMTAGINVMTFHPRGMWDGQHTYTLTGAVDDLLAAAAFVRSSASDDLKTFQGRTWRTDPDRIAVMGLSGGGGNVSLAACAEDPLIQSVIAVAANSMMDSRTHEQILRGKPFSDMVKAQTAGRVDLEGVLMAMTSEDFDRISPIAQAPRLVGKNVLLVGAQHDSVAPLETCHYPIADALRSCGVKSLDDLILETDHAFLTKRIALSRLTVEWLRRRCGFSANPIPAARAFR